MEKMLRLQTKIYGKHSSSVLKTLITLASINGRKGEIIKVREYAEQIREIEAFLPLYA